MRANTHRPFFALPSIVLVAAVTLATAAVAADGRGPGGTSPLVIPPAAFSADGENPSDYWVAGDYVEGGTNIVVHAAVYLPQWSHITSISAMMRDESATQNVHLYLKEAVFGKLQSTVLSHLETSGSSSSAQWDFGSPRWTVDTARHLYWIEARLPAADLRLYTVFIHYEDGAIFDDDFETGNHTRWPGSYGLVATKPAPAVVTAQASLADVAPATPLIYPVAPPAWMRVDDPEAQAALEDAFAGRAGYGSPLVVPGPAFKTDGYLDQDTYYVSEAYGWLYSRPGEYTVMMAPLNLPNGAHISWFMAWYMDSNPSGYHGAMRIWLDRMNTWDRVTENLAYEASTGAVSDVRSFVFDAGELTDPDVDYSHYTYWLTVGIGETDWGAEYYNRFYAALFLYTMP